MSDSGKEDQETYSSYGFEREQRKYIKIKCFRGNTMPIITANLREACRHDAVNCSTMARWFKQFQEGRRLMENDACTGCPSTAIDKNLIVIMFTVLNKDRQMML